MSKRIILSRKGFDSSSGGYASPIFSNKKLFSIPIPFDGPSPDKYEDIQLNGITAIEAFDEVGLDKTILNNSCHFDPDLNQGLFGQAGASQTELENNGVGKDDIFLFFGWFKEYAKNGDNLHHIFGWLQIDKIIKGTNKIQSYLKKKKQIHPHAFYKFNNNALYVGKRNLNLNGERTDLPGYGYFGESHESLILTEKNKSRSNWQLPAEYFSFAEKPFLNRLNWLDKKLAKVKCLGRGQEFILNSEKYPKINLWAYSLIKQNADKISKKI